MKVFSVYDSKAQAFLMPFFVQTIGMAERLFTDTVADPKSILSQHPADFTLFQIGEFDEQKGVLIPIGKHVNLGIASIFMSDKPKQVYIPPAPPAVA